MSHFVVGDIHGCLPTLKHTLDTVGFSPSRDTLWCVGDLVNRGPDSLGTVRYLMQLGTAVKCVLGNHDITLLAAYASENFYQRFPDFQAIVDAKDAQTIRAWLLSQPLMAQLPNAHYMVHAGLLPAWSISQAMQLASEASIWLQTHADAIPSIYRDVSPTWSNELQGIDRVTFIVNAFTRMRYLSAQDTLAFEFKGPPTEAPSNLTPWYAKLPSDFEGVICFGHWALLNGTAAHPTVRALDTGCVYGNTLSLYEMTSQTITQVPAVANP